MHLRVYDERYMKFDLNYNNDRVINRDNSIYKKKHTVTTKYNPDLSSKIKNILCLVIPNGAKHSRTNSQH